MEISDFATEILRHGNFPIYPVEPVIRHGNAVEICDCADEKAMLEKTVELIRKWQQAGHETIAVICRDEEETKEVSVRLGEKIHSGKQRSYHGRIWKRRHGAARGVHEGPGV